MAGAQCKFAVWFSQFRLVTWDRTRLRKGTTAEVQTLVGNLRHFLVAADN
jgi:hypothetical protein